MKTKKKSNKTRPKRQLGHRINPASRDTVSEEPRRELDSKPGCSALMALTLALLLPATPVTAAPPSPEEKTRAREHYQKGLTHYDIKEYSEALAEF